MNRYIAFLRAINVGGRFVKMAALRRQFEPPTFTDVQTYIQSGNVFFTSPLRDSAELEHQIEGRLGQALEFEVPAFVRTAATMFDLADYWPFREAEPESDSAYYVSFLKETPAAEERRKLLLLSSELDEFHVYNRHVFWRWRRPLGPSEMTNSGLERLLDITATRRNLNTVRKVVEKYLLTDG
ncbi:MAG: DUF1697 domain-containing protein [Candidatus Promineifilaceae bacterium]|nr:DUF1697 domain-containing protein [Candidatus Promineifilaceae bacterium]